MRFSIATPVMNGMPALRACVGSVRGQRGVETEHLIQDGGSRDGTRAWLASQAGLAWVSAPDAGMYDAINRAWSRATGEVFSWLNVDEQYLPGTLAAVDAFLGRSPEVDAIFGDTIVVDAAGRAIAARREIPLRYLYVSNGYLYPYSCTFFFRRRLWDDGRLRFDTRYRLQGDRDLILTLLEQGARFRRLPRFLALFGVGEANLSASPEMEAEGERAMQDKPRRFRLPALRRLALGLRHAEKLVRGCYRRVDLDYDFALDEKPTLERKHAARVSPFFAFTARQ